MSLVRLYDTTLPVWFRSVCSRFLAARSSKCANWLTVSVFSVCLIEAQVAREGRRIQKHGQANVLHDLGRATTPPQVSALSSCEHFTAILLRRQP